MKPLADWLREVARLRREAAAQEELIGTLKGALAQTPEAIALH